MNDLSAAFVESYQMLIGFDPALYRIIARSLQVSLVALGLALMLGLSCAALLALHDFRGKKAVLVLIHTLLSLPPVVVGLMIYVLFSFQGPLGDWGWLFTPKAMIVAQVVLIFPIITAYGHDILADSWQGYRDQLRSLGANRRQSALILVHDNRHALTLVALGGFGRAISEVGAVMIVGGNILHHTRVMTTSITLATSRGELGLALALGSILLLLALAINIIGHVIRETAQSS